MKLTNKQAIFLFQIARDTLNIPGTYGALNQGKRARLLAEIINQQSSKLEELDQIKSSDTFLDMLKRFQ